VVPAGEQGIDAEKRCSGRLAISGDFDDVCDDTVSVHGRARKPCGRGCH
jgi:hypothetical protein